MLAEVESLVRSQELVVDYVLSPVRTISTAMSIALAQIADGQIQEPFHPMRSMTVDEGMAIIFQRYRDLTNNVGRDKEYPIRLVVKDIIKYCDEPRWQAMNVISNNFVTTIREPSACLWSLLTRRANDLVEFGSDGLNRAEIKAKLIEISEEKWSDQSWVRLPEMISMLVEAGKKVSIVSGGALKSDPSMVLQGMCLKHGWRFQPQMVNGWDSGVAGKFFNPLPKYAPSTYRVVEDQGDRVRTAYWARAVESKGIDQLRFSSDGWVLPEEFLPSMRKHLLMTLYPSYVRLAKKSVFIDVGELDNLMVINPVEVFVILGIRAERRGLTEKEQTQLQFAKSAIDKRAPELLATLNDLMR